MLEWLDKLNRLESRIASALPETTQAQRSSQFADLPLGEFIPRVTPRFGTPRHLEPLVNIFERIAAGERVRAVVSTPPRHGKTETIIHGIAWLLLNRPGLQLAYASYAQ